MCFSTNQGKVDRDATPSGLGSINWRERRGCCLSLKKKRRQNQKEGGWTFFSERGDRAFKRAEKKNKRGEVYCLSLFFCSQENRELWCLVLAISGRQLRKGKIGKEAKKEKKEVEPRASSVFSLFFPFSFFSEVHVSKIIHECCSYVVEIS